MKNESNLRKLKYNHLNISTVDYDENETENDETTQFQDKSKNNHKDEAV